MDEITRTGLQYVVKDVQYEFKGNAQFLVNSALDFIRELESIIHQYQHIEEIFSLFDKANLGQIKLLMKKSQEALHAIISAQYNFESKVNNFLGRQIHFSWVDFQTGQILLVDEIVAKEIYNTSITQTSEKKNFTGKIVINEENQLKKKISELPSFIEKEYQEMLEKRIRDHQELFQTVASRYKDNIRSSNHPYVDDYYRTVYWKPGPIGRGGLNPKIPGYTWSDKTSKGDLSQAYISLIFNNHISLLEGNDLESKVGNFMNKCVKVSNQVPGIVKGDVKVGDGQVQIAVKTSKTFNTASIGPYVRVAYQIIEFYDNLDALTIDNVNNLLKNVKRYNQRVVAAGRKKAQKILNGTFQSTGAKVI